MNASIDDAPKATPLLVAWLDQNGDQVSFVAQRLNDGFWYANGQRIGTPTHWMPVPTIRR